MYVLQLFQKLARIVSNLVQNVAENGPKNASQWDGSKRKTLAREIPVKNARRNANHAKVGFKTESDLTRSFHHFRGFW